MRCLFHYHDWMAGNRWQLRNGFTLLELLVVTAIIALVAAIALPLYSDFVEGARQADGIADLMEADMVIQRHFSNNFEYPESLEEVGLDDLRDPWGQPFQYLKIEGAAGNVQGQVRKDRNLNPINGDFDLYSSGPDGQSRGPLTAPQSHDDLVRGRSGGFFGVAVDF